MMKMLKKTFTAVLSVLGVVAFAAGCTPKDPYADFKTRVPDSVQALVFINGDSLLDSGLVRDGMFKDLFQEYGITKDDLKCRFLWFVSKDKWGGVIIKSGHGEAKRLFEKGLAHARGKKEKVLESQSGTERIAVSGENELAALYNDNLLLCASNKTAPKFFTAAKPNVLFKHIDFDRMISGAVQIPPEVKELKQAATVLQMFPCLGKLEFIALSVPDPKVNKLSVLRGVFQDASAANEALAAMNMALGMIPKDAVKDFKLPERKVDKNVLILTFDLKQLIDNAAKFPVGL